MKLDLKVTHTPDTKSKKPWTKISWLGSKCDILLRAYCRLKVLHLQDKSHKKKKISRLQSAVKKLSVCNISQNGDFIVGIIDNGNVTIWSRCDDTIKSLSSPPKAIRQYFEEKSVNQTETDVLHKNKIFISNDARNILLVLNLNQIYLWEADESNDADNVKDSTQNGRWYLINRDSTALPPSHCLDAGVDSTFFEDSVLGRCNICSFIFYKGGTLQVSSVLIQWQEPWKKFTTSKVPFLASWHSLAIPVDVISPGCQPLHEVGALVLSHSHNGMLLAIGINQLVPRKNRVIFLSVLSHSIVVADLHSCGCKAANPNKDVTRTYWITDCSWSYNSLFLACIMKKGSLFILSSVGELLEIQTDGCSVVHGPSLFIPLHPLISVVSSKQPSDGQQAEVEIQNYHQQFSVTFHPKAPLLVTSDGFLATIIELPFMTTAGSLIRGYLSEGKEALYQLTKHNLPDMKPLPTLEMESKQVVPANDSKDATISKFLSTDSSGPNLNTGQYAGISDAKVIFGTLESSGLLQNASTIQTVDDFQRQSERCFLLAWLLGASQAGNWDSELSNLQAFTSKSLAKFCLASCGIHDERVPVHTLQRSLACVNWDIIHSNILCSTINLVHQVVRNLISTKSASTVSNLSHMFALLLHCEDKLDETYSMRAVAGESFQLDPEQRWHKSDEFTCPQTFRSLSDLQHCMWDNNADSTMRNVKGVTTGKYAITRGMIPAWKLLYHKTVTMYIGCNKHVQKHSRDETILSRIKSFLMNMMGVIQRKLGSIGYHASLHLHHFWTAEQNETYLKGCERFLLGDFRGGVECCWAACNSSKQQVPRQTDNKFILAILYSNLMSYNLKGALQMINNAIQSASVDAKKLKVKRSFKQLLEDKTSVKIPIFREDCRGVVMSMARFMALYFTNKPLIIYPPTSAKPLPVLFSENEGDVRTIVLHRHLIASKIQEQGLSVYWTPDLTLSLLLIGGLFPEAIWFSKEVGDWRSAFTLSVIYSMKYDHLTADGSHRNREELRLPDSLTASSLMCERLVALTQVPDNGLYTEQEESSGGQTFGFVEISDEAEDKLRKALLSIFLAGTLSGIELVPWLLGSILQQCLLTAYRLSSVVHEKYYLPAPPYYCPQPDYTPVEEDPVEVIQETTSRRKITLLVKQFLIVLEASNCSRVSARWYVEQLDNVQTWAYAKKRSESQDLPSALHQHVNFVLDIMDGTEAPDDIQPGTKFILKCFRDLCSLLWMLHLRDKLSEALRRGKIARYMLQICKTEDIRRGKEQLKSKQEDILLWAKLFLPFANVFGQSEDIKDIILTTVLELDLCKEHVANLAYSFYDEEAYPPGLTEKFQRLKKRLSQKKVYQERKPKEQTDESVKSISLLMYFKLQCKMRRLALRSISKAFGHVEETIFASTQGLSVQYSYDPGTTETPIVGSRELEYSPQFLNFLETFFLVTFGSLPNEKQQNFSIPLPLINEFYHDICNKELGLKLRKVPKRNECDVEISTEDLLKRLQNAQPVPQSSGAQSHNTQVDEGLFQKNFQTFTSDDVIEMYKWQKEDDVIVYNKEEVEVMEGTFLDLAVNKGFSKSNILWGSVYTRLQKLLNWLKVWPEQEHNSLLIDEADEVSGITLKLHPPSLLVVLGLWLLRHHLQETYKGRVWKDGGQVPTHEMSRRVLPEVKSQVAVSSDDLKKSKETHDLTRKQQIRKNLLSVSPVENESVHGGKKPQIKRDVNAARSKSVRRVLPSEPDKGSSVILRELPKHPVELVEDDNDDRDTRKNRLKTAATVEGKGVNSEPVPKTKVGGIMRADVHVYMDDSSSDTDVSEEEMFEQDEDVSLALPELSSHLVRKSSFGRYDKTRIPSVAEDIMGIHTSSSSFSAGLLQGDSNTNDITEKEPTFLRNSSIQQQNEQSEIFQTTQPELRQTEESRQAAFPSHQESQTVPIGIRTLVERQDTVVKTHQESQTSPVGIKTLGADAHHQESYSGLDKRHEGMTELNRADRRTGEHTYGTQSAVTEESQETPNMIAGQKDHSRSKGFLNKYVEGKQSSSVDALGLPFPILTLPKEEEVHLIDKQYRELPMQESRLKPIGTFPLLTLDRDVSPVIQAQRNKTQRVCLPLVQQTSVDEVKQAKIHTTEIHQSLPLRGRAIPYDMPLPLRGRAIPYDMPLLKLERQEPPQLVAFPKRNSLQGQKIPHGGVRDWQQEQVGPNRKMLEDEEELSGPEKETSDLSLNGAPLHQSRTATGEPEQTNQSSQLRMDPQTLDWTANEFEESSASEKDQPADLTPEVKPLRADHLQEQEPMPWTTSAATHLSIVKQLASTETTQVTPTPLGEEDTPPIESTEESEPSFLISGLRAVNRVVAPKIFMGYEKERYSMDEVKQTTSKEKSSSVGKSFLSVVDVGAGILRNLLNQPKEPELSSQAKEDVSNAELHYKSLFLRDADGIGPLEKAAETATERRKQDTSPDGIPKETPLSVLDEKMKLLTDKSEDLRKDLENTKDLLQTIDVVNENVKGQQEEIDVSADGSSHGDISLAGLPHVDTIPLPVQENLEGISHEEKKQTPRQSDNTSNQGRRLRERDDYQDRVNEARDMMSELLADAKPPTSTVTNSKPIAKPAGFKKQRKQKPSLTDNKHRPFTDIVRLQNPRGSRGSVMTTKSKTYAEMLMELKDETYGSAARTMKVPFKGKSKLIQTRNKNTGRENLRNAAGFRQTKVTGRVLASQSSQDLIKDGKRGLETRRRDPPVPSKKPDKAAGTGRRSVRALRESFESSSKEQRQENKGSPVSPRPVSVMRSRGLSHQPVPYVHRLQQATAQAPLPSHKDVYVFPSSTYTFKSPVLHSVPSRHQPYLTPRVTAGEENISDISSWSISDDVKQILYDESEVSLASEMSEQDSYLSSVDVKELENMASIGSGSSLSIDWNAVEDMVATIK